MKRVVIFTEGESKNGKRFEMLLAAVHLAGDKSGKRDRDTIRKEARILDALDAVSEPTEDMKATVCANCGCLLEAVHQGLPATRERRQLKSGDQRLELAADDYKLLDQYLETTPWLPSSARAAVDVLDWFSAAEKVE